MLNQRPPKQAEKLLHWFLRGDLTEEVLGDLDEKFYSMMENYSVYRAKINYWYQVMNYLRPFAIRKSKSKTSNYIDMFKHNFIISLRSFKYHKTSFLINLIGLSTGLACSLLIYLWVQDEVSIDKFHTNDKQLYQVMEHVNQGTGLITRQTTAGPMAEAVAKEMPEVERAINTTWNFDFTLSIDENDISAEGRYVSADYFKVFQFELLEGDESAVLADKKSIVISEELATRLFKTLDNVIGKTIEVQHERSYQVSGIFKNLPRHSSVQFDFVLTFEDFKGRNDWVTKWTNTAPRTFLLMKEKTDIGQFNNKIKDYIKVKTEGQATHRSPFITPFSDFYLYNKYVSGQQAGGRIEYVRLFSIIAVFILLIACINFINLSTARASKRVKEVGIKKTVGASRSILIGQYLSESTLMAIFSTILALIFVIFLLPQFNDITEKDLTLLFDLELISLIIGIILTTGLLAGSYPALYLSGFNAATILKGKLNVTFGEQWARKGLVVFQFTTTVILIVSVWVVHEQIEFVQTQNLGYDHDNILFVRKNGVLHDEEKMATFLTEFKRIPGVVDASSIRHNLSGHYGGTYGVIWPGKDPEDRTEFERVFTDYGVIEILGMQMKEGRPFSKEYSSDTSTIIFNEAAIQFMGLKDPIGKTIQLWGEDRQIIGVVRDFHFQSFHEEIKPLFFFPAPRRTSRVIAKIEAGKERDVLSKAEVLFEKINPGFPFTHQFLDDEFQSQYLTEQKVSTLSRYFAGLAIIISCLGLFGLATFTAERRLKEIGVRKVLGAGSFRIISLLTADFTKMVLMAIFIALPISYFVSESWLENFALRVQLEWWFFVGAGLLVVFISWLTVGIQTLKVANVNPVECLKEE